MKKKEKSFRLIRQKKKFDFGIFFLTLFLSLFGLLMIYEASNVAAFRDFGDKYHFFKEQGTSFLLGFVVLIIFSFISYKNYYFFSLPLLIFSLISLVAVFIPGIGIKALGAHRWVGIKPFVFQPSELTKIALVFYLAFWLSHKEKGRLLAFVFLFGLVIGLVVLQPDLGTAVILAVIFLAMYFLSGAPLWHFLMIFPPAIGGFLWLTLTSPYRLNRLLTFLNPNLDPLGSSYHLRQILISLGLGGFFGQGLGASRQKYQFLPEATTDSIFAIMAEEFGFIGSLLFIFVFLIFLFRIYLVAKKAPDKESYLLSGGILVLFAIQAIINLGAMVALFPLTGVPLPFISYGGSNLIVSFVAVGVVLNISRQLISHG